MIAPRRNSEGYALVIALSLMAFTLVLLLGFSALVRVESRSASMQLEHLQARQNALLGAMIALGDLQKYTGKDTRISASAGLLDGDPTTMSLDGLKHPNWTGVWSRDSSTGAAQVETWLVSGNRQSSGTPPTYTPELELPTTTNPVILRPENSLAELTTRIEVPSIEIEGKGAFAFAAIGEQESVRINQDASLASASTPIFLPVRSGIEVLGNPGFNEEDPLLSKLIYPSDLALLSGANLVSCNS